MTPLAQQITDLATVGLFLFIVMAGIALVIGIGFSIAWSRRISIEILILLAVVLFLVTWGVRYYPAVLVDSVIESLNNTAEKYPDLRAAIDNVTFPLYPGERPTIEIEVVITPTFTPIIVPATTPEILVTVETAEPTIAPTTTPTVTAVPTLDLSIYNAATPPPTPGVP